jgi:hypothetical protein
MILAEKGLGSRERGIKKRKIKGGRAMPAWLIFVLWFFALLYN